MEWVMIAALLVLAGTSATFYYWCWRYLLGLNRRLGGVEQRFRDGGVDLTDKMATDVIITEKWEEWDRLADEEIEGQRSSLPRGPVNVWDDQ